MTSTLHDHLARLADEATPGANAPSGRDLWERGRRYQRRRRAGTAVIAGVAAVLVLGIGTVSWQRGAEPPVVAPAGAPVGLPSQVHAPSRWLPGTEGHPLGQLIAIQQAERGGWWRGEQGVIGISATTGEYRFLDLPAASDTVDAALAPDGRHVAYWTTGATNDTPNTNGDFQRVVTGVGVYDPATGESDIVAIDTEHGLSTSLLAWIDADSLVIDFAQDVGGDDDSDMDQSSGRSAPALRWDLGADPVPFPEVDEEGLDGWGPSAAGRVIVSSFDSGYWMVGDTVRNLGGGRLDDEAAVDPTGTRWAVLDTGNQQPAGLAVHDGPGQVRPVPSSDRTWRVVGWADDQHVLVERRIAAEGRALNSFGLFSVDVGNGRRTRLVEMQDSYPGKVEWATDLLGAPVVDRPEPPHPMSPRLMLVLLVLTLGGAVFGSWRWRRRVQP